MLWFAGGMVVILRPASAVSDDGSAIDALVTDLGDDNPIVRRDAGRRLREFGLQAFEPLRAARRSDDIEIEMAAEYLIRELILHWTEPTDPPEVREVLEGFGEADRSERSTRIERLGSLDIDASWPALTRIAKFEPDERLAKEAALSIIEAVNDLRADPFASLASAARRTAGPDNNTEPATDGDDAPTNQVPDRSPGWEAAERIGVLMSEAVGNSTRLPVRALRHLSQDLTSGRFGPEAWQPIIDHFREDVSRRGIDHSAEYHRWVRAIASHAVASGDHRWATAAALDSFASVPPQQRSVLAFVRWANRYNLFAVVVEAYDRRPRFFDRYPQLLYATSTAHRRMGDRDRAEALALSASRLPPIEPYDGEDEGAERRWRRDVAEHFDTAGELVQTGMLDWAEREYRLVIESGPIEAVETINSRTRLASLLMERQSFEAIVRLLEPINQRLAIDDELSKRLRSRGFGAIGPRFVNGATPELLKSLELFARGEILAAETDSDSIDEAYRLLIDGFKSDPNAIDILIRLHRMPLDDERRMEVRRMIRGRAETYVNTIETYLNGMADDFLIGQEMNGYAWLVGNTEGDYRRALRYAERAVAIMPDAAWLDTLARCQFAVGQLEAAVATQRMALRRAPYSPPMRRQLEEFLAARSASTAADVGDR